MPATFRALTNNPFVNNKLTRFFGGSKSTKDPYLSGFFLVQFTLPNNIFTGNEGDVLTAVNVSVTLPDYAIEKQSVNALGGLKFHVPSALAIGDTLSMNFTEYTELPVFNTMRKWSAHIRSNVLGFASEQKMAGQNYNQAAYKGAALIVYCRPNMSGDNNVIEFACKCDGIWPTNLPMDGLAADIATIDKKDLTINFSCDLVFLDNWVYTDASTFVSAVLGTASAVESTLTGQGGAAAAGGANTANNPAMR